MGKVNVYDKIAMKKRKRRKYENLRNVYIIFHLKEDFGMELTAC